MGKGGVGERGADGGSVGGGLGKCKKEEEREKVNMRKILVRAWGGEVGG